MKLHVSIKSFLPWTYISIRTDILVYHWHEFSLRIRETLSVLFHQEIMPKRQMLPHVFFLLKNNNTRLKLVKNPANAMQHPEAELVLFENYSHSSSKLSSKDILRNKQTNKCVCIHEIMRLIIMKVKMKMTKRSHRYDTNRPRSRYWHKYSTCKKYLSMILYILSNT